MTRYTGEPMEEAWRGVGVHSADISPAPTSYTEEEPRNSKESRGAL